MYHLSMRRPALVVTFALTAATGPVSYAGRQRGSSATNEERAMILAIAQSGLASGGACQRDSWNRRLCVENQRLAISRP